MEPTNNKIVEKIRKLLALGERNANENEAQAAILKAHKLMAEHGINAVSTGEAEISYAKEVCIHKGNRRFRKILSGVIAENFRCKQFYRNGQVVFFGRSDDARIAKEVFEYTYDYAYRESNRLYAQIRKEGGSGKGVINSYAIGFIKGLSEKLGEQSTALMVIIPPDVKDQFAELNKGWRKSTSKLTVTNGGNRRAYNSGLSDGRTVMNGRRLKTAG